MMREVGEPGSEPIAFYVGQVMHARLKPKPHRFKYRTFMILLDLDRLDEAAMRSRLFRINGSAPLSFCERDHLPEGREDGKLAERVRSAFESSGITVVGCRVQILCMPRIFGYAFNPISIFYATDAGGRLRGLIYEVRNTFGERHVYAVGCSGDGPQRHALRKRFHVSPFLPMDLEYRFSVSPPGQSLQVRILESDGAGPILSAGFSGKHLEFANRTMFRLFFGLPLVTLKVIVGIHFEALRLYLKGLPVHPRPAR
jgi:uncharacterized protein